MTKDCAICHEPGLLEDWTEPSQVIKNFFSLHKICPKHEKDVNDLIEKRSLEEAAA